MKETAVQDRTGDEPDLHRRADDVHVDQREPHGPRVFTQTVQNNRAYWYRVTAVGPVVGDTVNAGFPTMSADSVSNTVVIQVGTSATPAAPIGLSAVRPWQPGQPVSGEPGLDGHGDERDPLRRRALHRV